MPDEKRPTERVKEILRIVADGLFATMERAATFAATGNDPKVIAEHLGNLKSAGNLFGDVVDWERACTSQVNAAVKAAREEMKAEFTKSAPIPVTLTCTVIAPADADPNKVAQDVWDAMVDLRAKDGAKSPPA